MLTKDGFDWTVAAGCMPVWEQFSLVEARCTGQLIKQSPVREVWSLTIGDNDYILKISYARGLWERLRAWLFGSKARTEWRNLQAALAKKVAVPQPVMLGEQGSTACCLLLRKIPDVRPLKEIAFGPLTFAARRAVAANLARLIAGLHRANILHRDCHFGNILSNSQHDLFVVDWYDCQIERRLSRRQLIENLAFLGNSFTFCAHTSDYLTFWREYCQAMPTWQRGESQLRSWSKQALARRRLDFWNDRVARCLKTGKYFERIELPISQTANTKTPPHGHLLGMCYYGDTQTRAALADLPNLIAHGTVFKNSRSSLVVRTDQGVLKQYRRKKWRNLILDCFRRSRAKRAWLSGYDCLNRGIPTAKPLAFLEERQGLLLQTSYLLTEEIKQSQTLFDCLRQCHALANAGSFARKGAVLEHLGRLLRLFHTRGLCHRDLKTTNFLVTDDRIYLIDLDGMYRNIWRPLAQRLKNLRRLVRSLRAIPGTNNADILRLLYGYLPFADQRELRWWARKILLL